jgi:hypothetical protein
LKTKELPHANAPLNGAASCGAKTRSGEPCKNPAMTNGRCRMHGGKSTGPPKGSQNALKHGLYTQAAIEERRQIRELIKDSREFITCQRTPGPHAMIGH